MSSLEQLTDHCIQILDGVEGAELLLNDDQVAAASSLLVLMHLYALNTYLSRLLTQSRILTAFSQPMQSVLAISPAET
jgi:hypothetical protein